MKYIYKFFGYGIDMYDIRNSYGRGTYTNSLWYKLIDAPIDRLVYSFGTIGIFLIILQFAGVVDVPIGTCILAILASPIWNVISGFIFWLVGSMYKRMQNEEVKKRHLQRVEDADDEIDEAIDPDELA